MANAGVVGMAEVIVPNSVTPGGFRGSITMWSLVWVGAAIIFLLFVNLAMIGRMTR